MRFPSALICLLMSVISGPRAYAQEDGIQRELIRRDQQADAFALQLKAHQEGLRSNAPGPAARELEQRRFERAQRLEQMSERQLQAAGRSGPAEQPYQRELAAQERRTVLDALLEAPPRGLEGAVRPLPLTP